MMNSYLANRDLFEELESALEASDFRAINSIDMKLAELMQAEERESGFGSMSEARQQCLATFNAEGYVNGNGFAALFQYMSDDEFESMLKGFETFGAVDLLKIVHKAVKKFPKSPPLPSHETREQILEVWDDKGKEPFEKLDDKFMEIGSAMNQRIRFIMSQPDQFFHL